MNQLTTDQLRQLHWAWAVTPQPLRFDVGGLSLGALQWDAREPLAGPSGSARPLVLVHGGAAHAFWWAHLAPFWARHRRVLALDLSGHGESSRKPAGYPRREWATEVTAVADQAGLEGAVYVGHSMGGLIGVVAASLFPESWHGLIAIDAPVTPRSKPLTVQRSSKTQWRPVYADTDSATKRFRLIPDQPSPPAELLDYVARRSLRPCPGGFTWKFDPEFLVPAAPEDMPAHLQSVRCPLHLLRGEHSRLVTPAVLSFMLDNAPKGATHATIAGGHHHLLLDHPFEVEAEVSRVLECWSLREAS